MQGIKVQIQRDSELVGKGIFGFASPKGNKITLYPDAFQDKETLVKTIAHERTHIYQFKTFGVPKCSDTGGLYEIGAYASENSYRKFFLKEGK